ncbi:MAG: transglycosylase SLT domain-containing protein [Bacteroidota bacterium]
MNARYKFYLVTLLLAGIAGFFIRATLTEDDKQQKEFENYYRIYALSIPDNLSFAGEKVPLSDFDVKERYDRELLTNVYWQSQTLLMLKRTNRFFPTIEIILAENKIPEDYKYLALAESGLQNVVSPAGAAGFWQMLDKTAKNYGLEITDEVDERYHLEKSTEAACKYFKEAYGVFNDWALVAASYNMGIDGVKRQLQSQGVNNYYDLYLNTETSRYVLRAIALKEVMGHPTKFGFNFNRKQLYDFIPTIKVKVTSTIPDLAKYALDNGANYKLLKLLNPWLRKPTLTITDGKVYYISLPKDKLVQTDMIAKVSNDTINISDTHFIGPDVNVFEHKIEKGETLQSIARKYNVSLNELKKWNNISNTENVKIGSSIRIRKNMEE